MTEPSESAEFPPPNSTSSRWNAGPGSVGITAVGFPSGAVTPTCQNDKVTEGAPVVRHHQGGRVRARSRLDVGRVDAAAIGAAVAPRPLVGSDIAIGIASMGAAERERDSRSPARRLPHHRDRLDVVELASNKISSVSSSSCLGQPSQLGRAR